MKRWLSSTLLIAMALAQAGDVFAQRPSLQRPSLQRPSQQRPSQQRPEGRASGSTLERSGLTVGQQMPDVTIYDESGEKFPLSRTKGKYAVLVFGCLT